VTSAEAGVAAVEIFRVGVGFVAETCAADGAGAVLLLLGGLLGGGVFCC